MYAQYIINTDRNMRGDWNRYTKKYTYGDVNTAEISFKFYENYISVNDNSHSIYRVIKKAKDVTEPTYKMFGWDCRDEQNRECRFSITKYNDPETPDAIMIIYPKIAFIYFIYSVEDGD